MGRQNEAPGRPGRAAKRLEFLTGNRKDLVDNNIVIKAPGPPPPVSSIALARTNPTKYAIQLTTLEECCPWYSQALAYWTQRFGASKAAEYAVACRLTDVDKSTMRNYRGKWNLFLKFSAETGWRALPAEPDAIQVYIGWLAKRGTIHADSMGQYLAAISKAHEHCGFPIPLQDAPISKTIQGLARLQKQVYSEDEVMYLPAEHAATALDWAVLQIPHISRLSTQPVKSWRAADKTLVSQFRDSLALVFNLEDFGRGATQHQMKASDIGMDDAGRVVFRLRHVKGRSGKKTNLLYQWPPDIVDGLTPVLRAFIDLRAATKWPAKGLFWRVPWERAKWDTNGYDTMLRRCLLQHGVAAPAGFSFSSRSLRSGAVSNSTAIGVAMEKIRYCGGWSVTSAVPETKYLDRTCPATNAAWRFFGWMIPSRSPPPT